MSFLPLYLLLLSLQQATCVIYLNETYKLSEKNGTKGNDFGVALTMNERLLVVGALCDDIDGKKAVGSVWIYKRSGDVIATEGTRVTPLHNEKEYAWFGQSLAITNKFLTVGAYGSGCVYIHHTSEPYLFHSRICSNKTGDAFGVSVDIKDDTLVVGAYLGNNYKGAAYIYRYLDDKWSLVQKLAPTDLHKKAFFGNPVGIWSDFIVVGSSGMYRNGSVYVFKEGNNMYNEVQKLLPENGTNSDYGTYVRFANGRLDVWSYGEKRRYFYKYDLHDEIWKIDKIEDISYFLEKKWSYDDETNLAVSSCNISADGSIPILGNVYKKMSNDTWKKAAILVASEEPQNWTDVSVYCWSGIYGDFVFTNIASNQKRGEVYVYKLSLIPTAPPPTVTASSSTAPPPTVTPSSSTVTPSSSACPPSSGLIILTAVFTVLLLNCVIRH